MGGIGIAYKSIGITMDNFLNWIKEFMDIGFRGGIFSRSIGDEIGLDPYSSWTTSKSRCNGFNTSFTCWSMVFKSNFILSTK